MHGQLPQVFLSDYGIYAELSRFATIRRPEIQAPAFFGLILMPNETSGRYRAPF